ncbi:hypothetical protein [Amycolatopsis sp. A1MSW2902]|uniref:hypothetical protein n=1 Tax=Amycolatopsis sp. A1MSW2902 TaxID=687413 RepID=UPI00307D5E5C
MKAFLKADILTEVGTSKETVTGTPQGGILSPRWPREVPVTRASLSFVVCSAFME